MKKGNLVIAMYSHPEYYPPTLNALEYLAKQFDQIDFVHRNITGFDWIYPKNVKMYSSGSKVNVRQAERQSVLLKIYYFISFTLLFYRKIKTQRPGLILIYDSMPFLSLFLFRKFISPKIKIWYHNHDVIDKSSIQKYSLNWFAWKSERKLFKDLSFFSLPSIERKEYFPMNSFKGHFYFLPNYPSTLIYERYGFNQREQQHFIKILYQGSIGSHHGLEEIIKILSMKIKNKKLLLILKGFISDEYKKQLSELAIKYKCSENLYFLPPTGYREVITNAQTCHIGIGIHKKLDIMNKTLGTASNKIYEYAASGMPVLIYDNEHFRHSLDSREWVFFTDVSSVSLLNSINDICEKFNDLSELAKRDFYLELSFEKYFLPVLSQISSTLM